MSRWVASAGRIGAMAVLASVAYAWAYSDVVRRQGRPVEDLPPYRAELLKVVPYSDWPSRADPNERGRYSGPGLYPRRSPDGRHVAVTTSWGVAIVDDVVGLVFDRPFYHTVAVWDEKEHRLQSVVSIMESDPHSGIAHRYSWSEDSRALLIQGTGRLPEDYGAVVELCLVYLPQTDELYRLTTCPPVWQRNRVGEHGAGRRTTG